MSKKTAIVTEGHRAKKAYSGVLLLWLSLSVWQYASKEVMFWLLLCENPLLGGIL